MSKGLGQFERWILIHTYLKTVKKELPADWKYPRGYQRAKDRYANPRWADLRPRLDIHFSVWSEHLMRAEILRNYFDLELSNRQSADDIVKECFRQTPAYRAALASLLRTLKRLERKGLIEWHRWRLDHFPKDCFCYGNQWDGCQLTPNGVAAAEKFLSANPWQNCHKLTLTDNDR